MDENIKQTIIEYFQTMKPFTHADDIPDLPKLDKETYESVIVPNLIRCGAIPKDQLKEGCTYYGSCRNSDVAKWNGKEFVYTRHKLWDTFDEEINHFQDDDGYDLFVPIKNLNDEETNTES